MEREKIIFTPLNAKIMGEDTIIPHILDHKYKILTYIDTTGCTACRLKLFDWKLFIKELNTFGMAHPFFGHNFCD